MTQAKNMRPTGILKPMVQLTFDWIYTTSVSEMICANVKVKKYQLKKLLIPFFPDSDLGLN